MTWLLMKRDVAWRMLPWAIAAAVLGGPWVTGRPVPVVLGVAWGIWAMIMPQIRVTLFEATLPVDGRQLLRARVISGLLFLWLPTLTLCAAVGLAHPAELTAIAGKLFFVCAAGSVGLAFMMTHELPLTSVQPVWAIAFVCGYGVLMIVFISEALTLPQTWQASCVCLTTAALLLRCRWPAAPLAFQCAPLAATRGARAIATRSVAGQTRVAFPWLPAFRVLFPRRIWATFICALTFPVSGTANFALIIAATLPGNVAPGLRWLSTLPISRQKLLTAMLGPWLAIYGGAYLFSLNYGLQATAHLSSMVFSTDTDLQVGLSMGPPWNRLALGHRPVITAPWGETFQPAVHGFGSVGFYDPWAWGPRSSPKFQDWQFRRATAEIYGQETPLAHSRSLKGAGSRLHSPRMQILNLASFVAMTLLMSIFGLAQFVRPLNQLPPARLGIILWTPISLITMGCALLPLLVKSSSGGSLMFEMLAVRASGLPAAVPVAGCLALWWLAVLVFREVEPGVAVNEGWKKPQ